MAARSTPNHRMNRHKSISAMRDDKQPEVVSRGGPGRRSFVLLDPKRAQECDFQLLGFSFPESSTPRRTKEITKDQKFRSKSKTQILRQSRSTQSERPKPTKHVVKSSARLRPEKVLAGWIEA
jgi:hypothetical protein